MGNEAGEAVISNHRSLLDPNDVINMVMSATDDNLIPSSSYSLKCVKDSDIKRDGIAKSKLRRPTRLGPTRVDE